MKCALRPIDPVYRGPCTLHVFIGRSPVEARIVIAEEGAHIIPTTGMKLARRKQFASAVTAARTGEQLLAALTRVSPASAGVLVDPLGGSAQTTPPGGPLGA